MSALPHTSLNELREQIRRLENGGEHKHDILPFGVAEIDQCLPDGGLMLGALHEMAGSGQGTVDGAAAALFAAGIAARTSGQVMWCVSRPDLFAPALAQAGLPPDRILYVEAGDDTAVLACFEEGLRHGSLGAVVAEIAKLPMTASRRLQLAAESGNTLGLAVRRWRREKDARDFGEPTAAVTRWRVSSLPSAPLAVEGLGPARWRLELLRCRGGERAEFQVEVSQNEKQNTPHRLAVFSDLSHGSLAPGRRHAS